MTNEATNFFNYLMEICQMVQ